MRYLLLLCLVFSLALVATPALAQTDIEIVSSSTQADFPDALTFKVVAQSVYPIKEIVLCYQVEQVSRVAVVSEVKLKFTPGERVEASWLWDMRKASLPPGAVIHYSWIIKDAQGRVLTTEATSVTFEDDRYSWQSLSEGKITLFWYKGNRDFAQELMNAVQGSLTRLAQNTGAELEKPVRFYIYENTGALRQALIFPQEWTGGQAFTDYGIVVIGVSPDSEGLAWGKRVLPHELTHLLVHQVTFSPYSDPPPWLDEGLATYAEGELRSDMKPLLQKAIAGDTLISVNSLSSSFPADPQQALLSYAESESIVSFLIKEYGRDKMLQLLESLRQGNSYNNALKQVYGFDIDGLDISWRASLGLPPRSTPTVAPSATASPTPTSVEATPTATATAATPAATLTASPKAKSGGSSASPWIWAGVGGFVAVLILLVWRLRR